MSPIQGTAPQAPPPPPPKVSNVPGGAQGIPGGADADGDNDAGAAAAAVA